MNWILLKDDNNSLFCANVKELYVHADIFVEENTKKYINKSFSTIAFDTINNDERGGIIRRSWILNLTGNEFFSDHKDTTKINKEFKRFDYDIGYNLKENIHFIDIIETIENNHRVIWNNKKII